MSGKRNYWRFTPEVVNGKCPTCEEETLLVSIAREYYRCISCGADLQQYINGHITYLPTITPRTPISAVKHFFGDGEA